MNYLNKETTTIMCQEDSSLLTGLMCCVWFSLSIWIYLGLFGSIWLYARPFADAMNFVLKMMNLYSKMMNFVQEPAPFPAGVDTNAVCLWPTAWSEKVVAADTDGQTVKKQGNVIERVLTDLSKRSENASWEAGGGKRSFGGSVAAVYRRRPSQSVQVRGRCCLLRIYMPAIDRSNGDCRR